MLILGASSLFGALNPKAEHVMRRLRNHAFNDSSVLKGGPELADLLKTAFLRIKLIVYC